MVKLSYSLNCIIFGESLELKLNVYTNHILMVSLQVLCGGTLRHKYDKNRLTVLLYKYLWTCWYRRLAKCRGFESHSTLVSPLKYLKFS